MLLSLGGVDVSTENVDEKFRKCLQTVWDCIPGPEQKTITDYWNKPRNQSAIMRPIFTFGGGGQLLDGVASGATNYYGFLFRFSQKYMADVDEKICERVIAHELAHLYDHATKSTDFEKFANEKMKTWGFEPVPIS